MSSSRFNSFALLKKTSTTSNLLNKLTPAVRCVSVAPSSLRSFTRSSDELIEESSDDSDDKLEMVEHRRSLGRRGYYGPNLYSGGEYVLEPYYGRNLFVVCDPRGERAFALRRGWDVVEDDDTMHLKVDMPGLGKEHVKVFVLKTTLVMEGEGDKEVDSDKEGFRWYRSMIDLSENVFKISEIKAEMKNGCLRVSVPKLKADEKKDVVVVTVQ